MGVQIINADVMDGLGQLPDESVHCVVTSPPYWGLRDYGTASWEGGDTSCDHRNGRPGSDRADGEVAVVSHRNRDGAGAFTGNCRKCGAIRVDQQIGLEDTPDAFVQRMVKVFQEVRRVLRKDGTCWLNLGDSYAGGGRGDGSITAKQKTNIGSLGFGPQKAPNGFKQKDLIGIPWRVALALQADGWWLRCDIIWAKPNPMPESVTDRPTKAHEYVFLLTRSDRYFYDADAIKEPAIYAGLANQDDSGFKDPRSFNGKHKEGYRSSDKQRGHSRRHAGFNDRWDAMEKAEQCSGFRNKRSVWTIATAPFPEAHFATFPPELPEICIKAGCPVGGTVMDPFSGAGTTCLVADRLQRNAIGIELNPEYAAMAEQRISGDRGGLLDLMETT